MAKQPKNKEVIPEAVSSNTNSDAILAPWITERSHNLMAENKYVFKVLKNSAKDEIKKAIEGLYKVTVTKINSVNIPAKKRVRGKTVGKKSGFKKAIITLKEGDKIELFEGA
jgi:large subunit ribosomal protein L23